MEKIQIQNIVFPMWNKFGLIGLMFRQCLRTREQPNGYIYDENEYRVVLRIIGGKVLFEGKPYCDCWKHFNVKKIKDIAIIGNNSDEGRINLQLVLDSITNEFEKSLIKNMFAMLKEDLLLVTIPSENCTCIKVTPEFLDTEITQCVDEWMETDENGNAEGTVLCIGDYLIVTDNGVYRIGHDEFEQTHVINLN